VTRRDQFISPQFAWLQACLDQSLRPTDRRVFIVLANAANRIAGIELDPALLEVEADAAGHRLLEHWALGAQSANNLIAGRLAEFALRLIQSRAALRPVVTEAIAWLPETFELQTLDGKTVHLSDLKGQVVLVDLWATWCTPCLVSSFDLRVNFSESLYRHKRAHTQPMGWVYLDAKGM
jgi:hypothetical protein